MLGLLLDAVVLIGLLYALNGGEAPSFGMALLASAAIAVGFLLCGLFLAPSIGLFSFLPMAAIAGAVLWIVFDVPPVRAAIGGAILLVYKIAMYFVWTAMLS